MAVLLLILCLLALCLRGAELYEPVTVDYIGGYHRLNEGKMWDFYFSCNVNGSNMQWVINGTGYRDYYPEQLRSVHRESLPTFNYTTTLLSSINHQRSYLLGSILIVSVQDSTTTINVGCVSDTGSGISSNTRVSSSTDIKRRDKETIRLLQLWDSSILRNISSTRCFICGVNSDSLTWVTPNGNQLGFDTEFTLGLERSLESIDNSLLQLQTILIALSPRRLVSIFLVTDSSVDSNISCNAGSVSLSLLEPDGSNPTAPVEFKTTATDGEIRPSSNDTSTFPSSKPSQATIWIAVVVVSAVVIFVSSIVFVLVIWSFFFKLAKKRSSKNLKFFCQRKSQVQSNSDLKCDGLSSYTATPT